MLSLSHTLISLPFAFLVDNPASAFLAAFIWHLFCDTLLHWNIYPHTWRRYPIVLVALDIVTGLFLAGLVMGDDLLSVPVLAAIAGGNVPDVLHGFWDILTRTQQKSLPKIFRTAFIFHERSQLETTTMVRGLLSQITLISISLVLLSIL